MSILNLILKPFTSFILYRNYQERRGENAFPTFGFMGEQRPSFLMVSLIFISLTFAIFLIYICNSNDEFISAYFDEVGINMPIRTYVCKSYIKWVCMVMFVSYTEPGHRSEYQPIGTSASGPYRATYVETAVPHSTIEKNPSS